MPITPSQSSASQPAICSVTFFLLWPPATASCGTQSMPGQVLQISEATLAKKERYIRLPRPMPQLTLASPLSYMSATEVGINAGRSREVVSRSACKPITSHKTRQTPYQPTGPPSKAPNPSGSSERAYNPMHRPIRSHSQITCPQYPSSFLPNHGSSPTVRAKQYLSLPVSSCPRLRWGRRDMPVPADLAGLR